MDHPPPEWHLTDRDDRLLYRGVRIASITPQGDGSVEVNTRCYSEGFTHSRRMATTTGARRYIEAWLVKWGDRVVHEVNNRVESARLEAERKASMPPVEIKPDPRRPRRGKKPF